MFVRDNTLSSEAKISEEYFRTIEVGQDILRLEVAMEYIRLMALLNGAHELKECSTELLVVVCVRLQTADLVKEIAPRAKVEDEIGVIVVLESVMDPDDVWIACDETLDLYLSADSLDLPRAAVRLGNDFYSPGGRCVGLQVQRFVDNTERSGAKHRQQLVSAINDAADNVRHSRKHIKG